LVEPHEECDMVDKAKPDAGGTVPSAKIGGAKPDMEGALPGVKLAGAKPTTPAAADTKSRAKRALTYTGLGLVALGGAYGAGRLQTQHAISDAQEQTQARAAAEAEQGKLRAEAAAKVRELEGRRQLSLSLVALDERNFGTAQRHLARAGALFAESKGDAPVEELARSVSGYKLEATDDIGKQRKLVMEFTQKFDTLRPPPE
jgi:hypothetical protein